MKLAFPLPPVRQSRRFHELDAVVAGGAMQILVVVESLPPQYRLKIYTKCSADTITCKASPLMKKKIVLMLILNEFGMLS